MDPIRKIIHIDMDAFYASVEQRDRPELKGKPVAVGGNRSRGVVAAASYEARKFGVHSAMPSKTALNKCPDIIFIQPDFDKYKKVSDQIRNIFHEYTELVEPLSLDEAYLDVTFNKKGIKSATIIAREIKQKIRETLHLTASAGVSYNKFLAKVASDLDKPDGLYVITPDDASDFVDQLEIKKFFGIGKVTAEKLNKTGIWFGRDLKKLKKFELIRMFGKAGSYYFNISRGIDNRPVEPYRERKSIGAEHTFSKDLYLAKELKKEINKIAEVLWGRLSRSGKKGRTLTLKIKYGDFEQITRSKTLPVFVSSQAVLYEEGMTLLEKEFPLPKAIRLLGLTVSNFYEKNRGPVQLTIDF